MLTTQAEIASVADLVRLQRLAVAHVKDGREEPLTAIKFTDAFESANHVARALRYFADEVEAAWRKRTEAECQGGRR